MATILQLKVAKRRLFEKVSLERCWYKVIKSIVMEKDDYFTFIEFDKDTNVHVSIISSLYYTVSKITEIITEKSLVKWLFLRPCMFISFFLFL